ncbi:hypothetical protein TNCV_3051871 [Trichonephila clavipes]|nr:hypothetical protein TNCV_3051871 [Trichonephila clavipes]
MRNPQPFKFQLGKLPTRTTQPTSRIRTLTFDGLTGLRKPRERTTRLLLIYAEIRLVLSWFGEQTSLVSIKDKI